MMATGAGAVGVICPAGMTATGAGAVGTTRPESGQEPGTERDGTACASGVTYRFGTGEKLAIVTATAAAPKGKKQKDRCRALSERPASETTTGAGAEGTARPESGQATATRKAIAGIIPSARRGGLKAGCGQGDTGRKRCVQNINVLKGYGQTDTGQNDGGQNDGGQNDGGQNDTGQNDTGQNDGGQNGNKQSGNKQSGNMKNRIRQNRNGCKSSIRVWRTGEYRAGAAGQRWHGWLEILGIDLTPRSRYRSYIARLERIVRSRSDEDNYLRGQLDLARTRIGHLSDYVLGLEETNDQLNGEVIRLRGALYRHRGSDGRFARRNAPTPQGAGAPKKAEAPKKAGIPPKTGISQAAEASPKISVPQPNDGSA